jgi:hypothetical protein
MTCRKIILRTRSGKIYSDWLMFGGGTGAPNFRVARAPNLDRGKVQVQAPFLLGLRERQNDERSGVPRYSQTVLAFRRRLARLSPHKLAGAVDSTEKAAQMSRKGHDDDCEKLQVKPIG